MRVEKHIINFDQSFCTGSNHYYLAKNKIVIKDSPRALKALEIKFCNVVVELLIEYHDDILNTANDIDGGNYNKTNVGGIGGGANIAEIRK